LCHSAKKNANRSSKSKAKNPGDGGGIAERVTSEPIVPTAASTDAAAGNGRAASAMQIVNIVHDTRQQISELRERTEKAKYCAISLVIFVFGFQPRSLGPKTKSLAVEFLCS